MATLLVLLKSKYFKWFLLGVVIVLLVTLSGVKVYNSGYTDGENHIKLQLVEQQEKFDDQRRMLNLRIQDLAKQTQQDLNKIEDKKVVTREKVYVYSTKHSGSTNVVDDEWLRIYNDSLPE